MCLFDRASVSLLVAVSVMACAEHAESVEVASGVDLASADLKFEVVSPGAIPTSPVPLPRDGAAGPRISGVAYISAFGGTGTELGSTVAADSAGNAYLVGTTATLCGATSFIFVEKLGPTGSLIYAVCLMAGTGTAGIAADASGNAYVAAGTTLAKIDPTGTTLLYRVTLSAQLVSVAVDASGNAYVAGPLTGAGRDVVVAKVNPAGSALVYGVSFGGTGDDMAQGIAVDGAGNAYVTGTTMSSDYPVANASQPVLRGFQDAFVSKLDAAGTQLLYSTYLGGNALDDGSAIAVDNAGNAYVGGSTSSLDGVESFPVTSGAAQVVPGGGGDAYLAKLGPSGAKLYASYAGGSGADVGTGVAVDRTTGAAVLTGWTRSTNFPTSGPVTSLVSDPDAFVAQLTPAGSSFSFARYLGGTSTDVGARAASDSSGRFYLTGSTFSPVFPLGGVATHGDFDAYVIKFNP